MLMMQRTWNDMQMEENVMGCYDMLSFTTMEENRLFVSWVWKGSKKS